jgi:hypothetical protein
VAATNPVDAILDAHWPGAKAIFADTESAISLAFLRRFHGGVQGMQNAA